MIRNIVCRGYRMIKGRELRLDPAIDGAILVELFTRRLIQLVRGILRTTLIGRPGIVLLGNGVQLRSHRRIVIGKGTFLDDGVLLDGMGRSGVVLGKGCTIGAYSRLVASTTLWNIGEGIRLGDRVGIGEFSRIGGSGGVEIGEDTIVGQYLSIHPENHIFGVGGVTDPHATERRPIKIGKSCWLGAKVTILSGVEIGDGCVVGAGSLVTKSVPPRSLVVGVPAKVIRSLDA